MGSRCIVLAAACCALAVAGCAAASVTTTASGPSPSRSGAGLSASRAASTGGTITLNGDSPGQEMAVTLVHVYHHDPDAEFATPEAGDRFISVQLRLRNVGSAAYSDSPDNEVAVVDSMGQSYQSWITAPGVGCPQFPATEKIAPGDTGLGCIVFQVPSRAKITKVQVTLNSGFANQTGQWAVAHG